MLGHATSIALLGLKPVVIHIEVLKKRGIPGFYFLSVSGHKAIALRQKLSAASQVGGWQLPSVKWLINTYPRLPEAQLALPYLELPMLVAVLRAQGLLPPANSSEVWAGELGLDGLVRLPPSTSIKLIWAAQQQSIDQVYLPTQQIGTHQPLLAQLTSLPKLYNTPNLASLNHNQPVQLTVKSQLTPVTPGLDQSSWEKTKNAWLKIHGQWSAKRALVLATLGQHATLLIGPPGVGKTYLCQHLAGWLPNLTPHQQFLAAAITSSDSELAAAQLHRPPLRQPHHTLSPSGLLGGGQPLKPGELALANHGLLVLDELAEFPSSTLEALRQPLESKVIQLHKNQVNSEWPVQGTLVATTNPCRCGYWQHPSRGCQCNVSTRQRYWEKLSGPILDRLAIKLIMDPQIYLPPAHEQHQLNKQAETVLEHWYRAVNLLARTKHEVSYCENWVINAAATKLWQQALPKLKLSFRSHQQTWQVAKTIARFEWALEKTENELPSATLKILKQPLLTFELSASHVAEALSYHASWGQAER